MIKTRSTYRVNFDLDLTYDTILNIYIWSGLQASKPATPTYVQTITNPTSALTSYTDINTLIKDYIEFSPQKNTTTSLIDGINNVWVSVDQSVNNVVTNVVEDVACIGYGYTLEGLNADKPTNNILLQGNDFRVNRNGNFIVPLYADGGNVTAISYPNNEINFTGTLAASTDSSEIVQYLFIENSETITDEYIEVTYNSEIITLYIYDEYKYNPIDLHFINKEGHQQVVTFFKERKDSIEVNGDSFQRRGISVLTGEHQFKDYNKNSRSKFNINSGFIDESNNETFKQLLLSESIWLLENDSFIPLNIESKSLEYQTQLNDKLIKYNLEFSYSFNDILN